MDKFTFCTDTFIPLIKERMEEIFPDIFTKSRTTDREIYNDANGNIYKFYLVLVNALVVEYSVSPDYKSDEIEKMYNDFKETDKPLEWLIRHLFEPNIY